MEKLHLGYHDDGRVSGEICDTSCPCPPPLTIMYGQEVSGTMFFEFCSPTLQEVDFLKASIQYDWQLNSVFFLFSKVYGEKNFWFARKVPSKKYSVPLISHWRLQSDKKTCPHLPMLVWKALTEFTPPTFVSLIFNDFFTESPWNQVPFCSQLELLHCCPFSEELHPLKDFHFCFLNYPFLSAIFQNLQMSKQVGNALGQTLYVILGEFLSRGSSFAFNVPLTRYRLKSDETFFSIFSLAGPAVFGIANIDLYLANTLTFFTCSEVVRKAALKYRGKFETFLFVGLTISTLRKVHHRSRTLCCCI